jgi:chemotaxis protein histidine kinase CheA
MSTPEGQLGGGASVAEVTLPQLDPTDSWLTDFHIDDPIDLVGAPLPAEAGQAGTEEKPTEPIAEAAKETVVEEPKPADAAKPAVAAAPVPGEEPKPAEAAPVVEPAKAAVGEEEQLTAAEEAAIAAVPEAERPAFTARIKGQRFMSDFYLNHDKPMVGIREHLREKSPSRYGELETSIIADHLAKPAEFCQNLNTQDRQTYIKLANEIYNGDPKYFAKQVTGRDNVEPETVQTALDFYERNKDRITDDDPLATDYDEETWAELERYHPELVPDLKAKLAAAKTASEENKTLKAAKPEEADADPNKQRAAEAEALATAARVETEAWDAGRDTVSDFVEQLAKDPTTGAGIAVTPEERKSSPLVARLKDFKANVLFDGLVEDGKQLLPGFQEGLTTWGKERPQFKEVIDHMAKFAKAGEKHNVLDVVTRMFPQAKTYYEDRLKHPIFKEIDDLLALVTAQGSAKPRMDPIVTGALPSGGKATPGAAQPTGNANSDAYLIADAIGR